MPEACGLARRSHLRRGPASAGLLYLHVRQSFSGEGDEAGRCQLIHVVPGHLPPVNGFWSLTMYELPSSLLVANPLNRYLLNAPMLPQFTRDADGGLTLLMQNESPGKDGEANWLPAPKGPFWMAMRLYWPKDEALNRTWTAPG